LTLDDDVAKAIAARMRSGSGTMKETVNDLIRRGLARERDEGKQEPFVVHARSLGVRPGLDYDNIGRLIEHLEGPNAR
jgi:hypothetical protein